MGTRAVRRATIGRHAAVSRLSGLRYLPHIRRELFNHGATLACAIGAAMTMLGAASADTVAVMDRPRPAYDAKGIPLGAFRLFPAMDLRVNVGDNVFQTDTKTTSDVNLQLAPSVKLVSEWSQHMVAFFGKLNTLSYADHSSENVTDWAFGAEGRVDVRRGTEATAAVSKVKAHERRSSPNSPGDIAEPVGFERFHGEVGLATQPNHLRLFVGGEFDSYAYETTPLNGGGILDNGDRDRDEYRVRARASLELSEGYLGFVEAAFDRREFERTLDRTGVNRDSHGLSFSAGLEFRLVAFLQGEVFVGYLDRQYGAPLRDFSGLNYGSALKWTVTPLTTVHVTAARVLNDTTVAGSSVIVDNTIGIGIDHELRRNLIVQASLARVDSHFVGTPRNDNGIEGRLGATYLIDSNLSATAGYERLERDSNAPGEDFSEDRFNVGLRVQF